MARAAKTTPKAIPKSAPKPKTTEKSSKGTLIKEVQKRNGQVVPFDIERVVGAINKAMIATGEGSPEESELVANQVYADLVRISKKHPTFLPTVEGVQNSVEKALMLSEYVATAKAYILYREKRNTLRYKGIEVPEKVKKLADESKTYFRNSLGEFVYLRTYSQWMPEEGRRETWVETVDRYVAYMRENLGKKLREDEYKEIRSGILNQEAMPSMRLLQFAGKAARATNVCAYNCSFTAPESFQDIAEIMYISMCGTGVGFSAESENVGKFPQIKRQTGKMLPVYAIDDSKEGWCDAFVVGTTAWADGQDIKFDFSKLRLAGARLATMGGKSSGPEPLRQVLAFARTKILARQGKRLTNLDIHDIVTKIAEVVVAGGVRRSALLSLSDLDDKEIRDCKKGQFWNTDPQRMLANNSAVYMEKPTSTQFMEEWIALMNSGTGERGIFNRAGIIETLPTRRAKQWSPDQMPQFGVNPCGEIILQPRQFCNLSAIVARSTDTEKTLLRKIRLATILGTYQASLTNFPYLSKKWKANCEKEALLGVSITGQWDCPAVRKPEVLRKLRAEVIRINKVYAKRFGINESTSTTDIAPSGNGSQTFDCSSGLHPRHAPYYIRRVRIASTDSLFKMLRDQGVPYHPEVGQNMENATTYVVDFPVKAPGGSVFKNDLSALQQLEYWKMVKLNYTEHNPSTTISIGDDEWIAVANWLYENWNILGGLSFLPRDNHVYQLAPYEEIDEKQYTELLKRYKDIDFSKIMTYEMQDETEQRKELACSSGVCEVDDIPVGK